VFIALTIVVTSNRSLEVDSQAFKIADDLRARWLDHAARALTTLGLIAVVGPVVVLGALHLYRRRYHARVAAVLTGGAVAWITVWIVKAAVDRPRPPAPLVHTSGQSFPSGHAANAIGYLALAIALTVAIRTRAGRVAVVVVGALLAVLVGLSRIYLRAHYASDVVAGEALAVGTYAIAAMAALIWQARRRPPAPRADELRVE
jgi:membrane-associated phospholipid phosphatase